MAEGRRAALREFASLGLCAYLASVPIANLVQIDGLGTLSRTIGLMAGIVGLSVVLTQPRHHRFTEVHTLMAAFAGFSVLALAWSEVPALGQVNARSIVQHLAILALAWELLDTEERTARAILAYAFGAWLSAAITVAEYLREPDSAFRFTGDGLLNPNGLGVQIALIVPLAWVAADQLGGVWPRALSRTLLPLSFVVAVLTASRTTAVIVFIVALVVPATAGRIPHWAKFAGVVALVIGAYGLVNWLPEANLDRLATTDDELTGDGNFSNRVPVWEASFEGLDDHGWIGVGLGGSERELLERTGLNFGAHNTALDVMVQTGVIGMVILLVLCGAIAKRSLAGSGADKRAAVLTLLALAASMQTLHWGYRKPFWALLILLLLHGRASAWRRWRQDRSPAPLATAAP